MNQKSKDTIIVSETTNDIGEPYYPVPNKKNLDLYEKYKKLAELSSIKDGDEILEIGCGWGGFSEFIGNNYDCKVTAVTISEEQFNFAKNRINEAKLSEKVNILFIGNFLNQSIKA